MSGEHPTDQSLDTIMAGATDANLVHSHDSAKESPSRPPSPPTRPDTPRSSACPPRLQALIPPPNFGAVERAQIFRSAFPQDRNLDFVAQLGLKSMLVLVDTSPSDACNSFVQHADIIRARVDIAPNKEGNIGCSVDSICQALLFALDVVNHPLYIHCNQGRHRTGCVIACLRKLQGWPLDVTLEEYETYASPKAREGDIKFISDVFQADMLLKYAKEHGSFDHRPSLTQLLRSDLIDTETLIQILASTDGVARPHESLESNTSSKADSGVDVPHKHVSPDALSLSTHSPSAASAGQLDVPVEEYEFPPHPVADTSTAMTA